MKPLWLLLTAVSCAWCLAFGLATVIDLSTWNTTDFSFDFGGLIPGLLVYFAAYRALFRRP